MRGRSEEALKLPEHFRSAPWDRDPMSQIRFTRRAFHAHARRDCKRMKLKMIIYVMEGSSSGLKTVSTKSTATIRRTWLGSKRFAPMRQIG